MHDVKDTRIEIATRRSRKNLIFIIKLSITIHTTLLLKNLLYLRSEKVNLTKFASDTEGKDMLFVLGNANNKFEMLRNSI